MPVLYKASTERTAHRRRVYISMVVPAAREVGQHYKSKSKHTSAHPCHQMTELKGMPRSGRSMDGAKDLAAEEAPDSRAPVTLATPLSTAAIEPRSIQDWMLLPGHATCAAQETVGWARDWEFREACCMVAAIVASSAAIVCVVACYGAARRRCSKGVEDCTNPPQTLRRCAPE